MKTPVEILLSVGEVGGRLDAAGDRLRIRLPADCDPTLKEAIRGHKATLLELLRLNFLIVRSDTVGATLLWTPDDATKESLVAAGADPGSIYTAAELHTLVQRRVTAAELPLIHTAKQRFEGRLR